MYYIIGLGNPGEEYLNTRHNTGRMAVSKLCKDLDFPEWNLDNKSKSQISKGKIKSNDTKTRVKKEEQLTLILPETFMNKSGDAVSYFIKPVAKAASAKVSASRRKGLENLIIVHDDLDLPIGTLKISYNKGVGGHRGLDSVVKAVKTLEFVRIRIGISPHSAKASRGKPAIKKPGQGLPPKASEKAVIDFILGKFKPSETEILKKTLKKASEAIQTIVTDGRDRAMNMFN
jgi:peptidyl-tRNA hydrolase, PTH1 family